MNTYLFTWNPKLFPWEELTETINRVNQEGACEDNWSCGVTKSLYPGDRFFLVKLGRSPKGIIGSGYVTSKVMQKPHFIQSRAERGETQNCVDIVFEVLSGNPIISEHELDLKSQIRLEELKWINWFPQSSGITIPDSIVGALEGIWRERTNRGADLDSRQLLTDVLYLEGKRLLKEYSYTERNYKARNKCIEIYGYTCYVCGFNFKKKYGDLGKDYIHVHHRKPLSQNAKEHTVNPESDLVPICPNCHAMIHRNFTMLDVDDLKKKVNELENTY